MVRNEWRDLGRRCESRFRGGERCTLVRNHAGPHLGTKDSVWLEDRAPSGMNLKTGLTEGEQRVGCDCSVLNVRVDSKHFGICPRCGWFTLCGRHHVCGETYDEVYVLTDPTNLESGLTEGEQRVMDHLVDAFNLFSDLERTHPSEMDEFVSAIHRLQDLLAVRIVRRQFPKGWPTFREQKEG